MPFTEIGPISGWGAKRLVFAAADTVYKLTLHPGVKSLTLSIPAGVNLRYNIGLADDATMGDDDEWFPLPAGSFPVNNIPDEAFDGDKVLFLSADVEGAVVRSLPSSKGE